MISRRTNILGTTPAIKAKWDEYARTGAHQLRDELITYFIPLAKFHADRVAERLPRNVCRDDAFSAALVGLVKAVDGFDIARGHTFETYAAPRIRGAIIDEFRAMDWVPRMARDCQAKLRKTIDRLRGELNREPTRDELVAAVGSEKQLARLERESTLAARLLLSHHGPEVEAMDAASRTDVLAQSTEPPPDEIVAARDAVDVLLADLPGRERHAITEVHLNERRQTDVARAMGRSPGIVWQRRGSGMAMIRDTNAFKELEAAA